MNVITIGLSPYLLTSRSKVNSLIMKQLYLSGQSVAGIVWGHDKSYFIPEKKSDGSEQFYYEFEHKDTSHKIPIVPFDRGKDDVVAIYDILNIFQPDVVITVGDCNDFLYMKAIKQFYGDIKWLFVMMNYAYPINENNIEMFESIDAVLCTSKICHEYVKKIYAKDLYFSHVGIDRDIYKLDDSIKKTDDVVRVLSMGKNVQSDNVPMVMEVISELHGEGYDLELQVLSNIDDQGDHDLHLIKSRLDPNGEYIKFPDKYVSLIDGLSVAELVKLYNSSDLFISVPMVSATSISVLESIACGCFPLLSDCGSNRDIADILENSPGGGFSTKDFLIPCIRLYTRGESYLNICDPRELKKIICTMYEVIKKKKGNRKNLSESTIEYIESVFLNKITEMIIKSNKTKNVVCLETV